MAHDSMHTPEVEVQQHASRPRQTPHTCLGALDLGEEGLINYKFLEGEGGYIGPRQMHAPTGGMPAGRGSHPHPWGAVCLMAGQEKK